MKTLYIDCGMGAAGDMLTAALLDLMPEKEEALKELNELGIPGVEFKAETAQKCGVTGTHMHVLVNGEEESEHMHEHHHHHHDHDHDHGEHEHSHGHHHHSGMHDIEHIVNGHINVSDEVKKNVMSVYDKIAQAESTVHGTTVEEIHFHEVGTMDAVADITAVSYLISKLDVDQIICSPVHVGKGTVKCAHGILPVPAPATALILEGIPIYSKDEINGELCTPTGAALLKTYVDKFESIPIMTVEKIGYGLGTKDFPIANCLRVMLGETPSAKDKTVELDFNVDDMTGEEIGFATEKLLDNGAREVFVTPVQMKKNRPGSLVCVLCGENDREKMVDLIFKYTTTIGIRETLKDRYVLDRSVETRDTEFGEVRVKKSSGYGVSKEKYEYEDLAKLAKENDCSVKDILDRIKK